MQTIRVVQPRVRVTRPTIRKAIARRLPAAALTIALTLTLALAVAALPAAAEGVTRLSIATGTTGGVYYPVGGAMAQIWNQHVPGVEAVAEATGASVENLRLIERGESQVALVQGDVAYNAYYGQEQFQGRPIAVRTLIVMYPNVYHAVSLKSIAERLNFRRFSDIRGHRYSVGPPGSGNEVTTRQIFDALGMTYNDIRVQRLSYAETARALREGRLDAGSWQVGLGNATLVELDTTHPIFIIPIAGEERQKIIERYPYYYPFTIPAGTYPSVREPVQTIALWNVVVVPANMSEEMAYRLARAIYENVDGIARVYPPGAPYFTLDNLKNSPIPLHPGVVRYAREKGVDVGP